MKRIEVWIAIVVIAIAFTIGIMTACQFMEAQGSSKVFPSEWAQPEIACKGDEHGSAMVWIPVSSGRRDIRMTVSFTCSGGFPKFKAKESKP